MRMRHDELNLAVFNLIKPKETPITYLQGVPQGKKGQKKGAFD